MARPMNSNVNIVKDGGPDQNPSEWPAKRYSSGQQFAAPRPSALAILAHAPWSSLVVLFGFALVLILIVWRVRVVWCYENGVRCAEQSDQF